MRIKYHEIENGWIVEVDPDTYIREIKEMFFKSKNRALAWIRAFLIREKEERQ